MRSHPWVMDPQFTYPERTPDNRTLRLVDCVRNRAASPTPYSTASLCAVPRRRRQPDESVLPSAERMIAGNAELVALVDRYLPQRVYRTEPRFRVLAAASLVRMAEAVETIMALLRDRRDIDALVLVRSLYEQAVTFMWVGIDPYEHADLWVQDAERAQLKIHNEAKDYGFGFLTPREVASAERAKGMPRLADRAKQVDLHLTRDIAGMHDPNHPFSVRGLYTLLYRPGSRPTHSSPISLDPYITDRGQHVSVERPDPAIVHSRRWYALVAPIFTMALIVASGRYFNWLDEAEIRAIHARATELG
jgi:hypothetical protein